MVVASLPLVLPACGNHHNAPPAADLSAVSPGDDLDAAVANDDPDLSAVVGAGGDLATTSTDLADPCDNNPIDPPPAVVSFPAGDVPDAGFATPCQSGAFCAKYCPSIQYTTCCGPTMNSSGGLELDCILNCTGPGPGRRPEGLLAACAPAEGCVVGQYFAHAAHLEAASVHAFRRLARELGQHGAPSVLIAQARRAQRDEIRHARVTRRLARAHGSVPLPVRVAKTTSRTLEDIAVENVVEGCVRETFAAVLAVYQSRAAADSDVRAAMAQIAPDETRHAELAWAVDAWLRTRLGSPARRRVADARRTAVAQLVAECAESPPSLAHAVGLPNVARTRALLEATRRGLWS
ncbi:MAG TPA: ferritin-like domain-containing protein [Polyangia bacterium]